MKKKIRILIYLIVIIIFNIYDLIIKTSLDNFSFEHEKTIFETFLSSPFPSTVRWEVGSRFDVYRAPNDPHLKTY